MKVATKSGQMVTTSQGVGSSNKIGIAEEGMNVVRYFMRDKIYSDKELAVVREYLANALDEHVKHKIDKPVDIGFKSINGTEYFIVRDYAKGMSDEQVKNNFGSYCNSTKNTSNQAIGGFGIGSKAGHCYADVFNVISCFEGKKTTYSFVINGDEAEFYTLSSEDSNDPSGVEIQVPIDPKSNYQDVYTFASKIKMLYPFISKKVNIIAESSFDFANNELKDGTRQKSFSDVYYPLTKKGNIFKKSGGYYDGGRKGCILIGFIPYKIDSSFFQQIIDDVLKSFDFGSCDGSEISNEFNHNICIQVPIGSIAPSLSRESVETDNATKRVLTKIISSAIKELIELKKEVVKKCDTVENIIKYLPTVKTQIDKLVAAISYKEIYNNLDKNHNYEGSEFIKSSRFTLKSLSVHNGVAKIEEKLHYGVNDHFRLLGYANFSSLFGKSLDYINEFFRESQPLIVFDEYKKNDQNTAKIFTTLCSFFKKGQTHYSIFRPRILCIETEMDLIKKDRNNLINRVEMKIKDIKDEGSSYDLSQENIDSKIKLLEEQRDAKVTLLNSQIEEIKRIEKTLKKVKSFNPKGSNLFFASDLKETSKEDFFKNFGIENKVDISKEIICVDLKNNEFIIVDSIPDNEIVITASKFVDSYETVNGDLIQISCDEHLYGMRCHLDYDCRKSANESRFNSSMQRLDLRSLGIEKVYVCTRLKLPKTQKYLSLVEYINSKQFLDSKSKSLITYKRSDHNSCSLLSFITKCGIDKESDLFEEFEKSKRCLDMVELFNIFCDELRWKCSTHVNLQGIDIEKANYGSFFSEKTINICEIPQEFPFSGEVTKKIRENNEKNIKENHKHNLKKLKEAFSLDRFQKYVKILMLNGGSRIKVDYQNADDLNKLMK